MTTLSRRALLLGSLAVLTTAGCSEATPAATPSPAPTSAMPPARGALPGVLQGTWMVELTSEQIRHDLQAAGLGRYAGRFLRAERLTRRTRLAVTYRERSFEIAWHRPDGTWYVGWYGDARDDEGRLTVTDAESQTSDTYRWTRDGDQLTLRFLWTTTPDQHGIPFEAYSRAYFSRPLRLVDCSPEDLDAC